MKPKLLTGKRLTNKLDATVRLVLKKLHPNPKCFVCHGRNSCRSGWFHPKENPRGCQVGHFIKRKYTQIRWDLKNMEPQGAPCNHLHNENPIPYTRAVIQAYGNDRLDYLDKKQKEKTPTTLEKRAILADLLQMLDN